MNLTIATASRKDSVRWRQGSITWADLCAWVDEPATTKECGGYVLGKLRGERRRKDTVISRSAVTLDADTARPELPELIDTVFGYLALIHTTYSHEPDAPRYRLVLPTDREMDPDEYRKVARVLMDKFGAEQFDPGSTEPERFMYRPSAKDPEWFQSWVTEGTPVSVDALLAEYTPAAPEPEPEHRPEASLPDDVVRRHVARALTDLDDLAALPEGQRLPWPGEPDGVGWDRGTWYAAQRLVEAANSGTAYTLADARADFMEHAPAAEDGYSPAHKWTRAVRDVGTRPIPHERPEDVFTPLPAEPALGGLAAKFPRVNLAALVAADRPPRQWVVHGLLPAGASVALVSPAGVGKSLLALAMALTVARGEASFAGLAVPRARRVLYVDQENTLDDVAERLEAFGVSEDVPGLVYLSLPPLDVLDTEAGGQQLAAVLDLYGIGSGDLVVLDSLQRVIGGPENDADTMRAYYRHTAKPLKARGVTVLRLDNSGKDTAKGARGTSSKRDDVDVELLLAPGRDPDLLQITTGKVRIPDIRALEVERTTDDDGLLRFTTAADPHRSGVDACLAALAEAGLDPDAGWRLATDALARAGHKFARAQVRDAVRLRKSLGTPL